MMLNQSCEQEESSTKCEFGLCDGNGWIQCERGVMHCKCYKKNRAEEQLKYSGLEKLKDHYSLQNYEAKTDAQQRAKDVSQKYAKALQEGSAEWFLALGQSGAGKTHLCSAICFEALDNGLSVRYAQYREMVMDLKRKVLDEFEYKKTIEKYKNCAVLYLDDLYKGKITEADINIIYELINYRYNNDKPTIISSECSINQLNDIDCAIAGRMIERAGANVLMFKDKSMNYRLGGKQ